MLGSIIAVFAQSIDILLLARLLQGAGVGGAGAIARAVVRDVIPDNKTLAKVSSYLAMIAITTPIFAPLIGGYLQHYFGWRSNFIFLLSYGFIILSVMFFLFPETNQHLGEGKFSIRKLWEGYQTVLKHPIFIGGTLNEITSILSSSSIDFLLYNGFTLLSQELA